MMTRRDLIKLGAGVLLIPSCKPAAPPAAEFCAGSGDELDVVLEQFHLTDPEFSGGLSNHGPMAAEVLFAQSHAERICDWSRSYHGYLNAMPAGAPIPVAERAAALGNFDLRADWIATYDEMVTGDLSSLLSAAWPVLLSGYSALHGILRTGHALRGLSTVDTRVRRRELAHGLGYWAARHELLPGSPGSSPQAGLDVVTALTQLPVLPTSQQSGGLIKARFAHLVGFQPFIDALSTVDVSFWPVEQTITELAAACARLYLGDSERKDLGYLHTITASSALRLLLPWMDAAQKTMALQYLYQTVAAVHAAHAAKPGVPTATGTPKRDAATLREQGAADEDEHTIKLVEALLREYAIDPRPEFLVAAELRLNS